MDLQEFRSEMLYFESEANPEIEDLVKQAAANYGPVSERLLLKALTIDEQDLTVLIGLYRFYYYQHRYEDGLDVANKVMAAVARRISIPEHWQDITKEHVAAGLLKSFCMVRLYFFALKAAGYLQLRMKNYAEGRAMIEKVVAMDSKDRLGAKLLLEVLDSNSADVIVFKGKEKLRQCNGTV